MCREFEPRVVLRAVEQAVRKAQRPDPEMPLLSTIPALDARGIVEAGGQPRSGKWPYEIRVVRRRASIRPHARVLSIELAGK